MSIFLCFQVYSICTKQTLLQNFAVLYHGGTVLKLQNISLLLSTVRQIFFPLETGPPPDFLGLPLRVSHPPLPRRPIPKPGDRGAGRERRAGHKAHSKEVQFHPEV